MVVSLVQENSQLLSSKNDNSSVSIEELKNSALKALNNKYTPDISSFSPRPDGSEFKVLSHSIDVSGTNAPDLAFVITETTNSIDNQGLSISFSDLRSSDIRGLEILTTNSRGEITKAFPDSDIYAQIGLSKNELAQFAFARFEAISNNTVEQQVEQFKQDYPIDSTISSQTAQVGEKAFFTTNNSTTWIESLKFQIDNIDGSKVQVFCGKNKVYEQTDNVVTTDKLATPIGEKVQQALENPGEAKGSVRIMVDGEKVYHAKNGQVLENKHSLTLENSPITHQKSLNVTPEVAQVSEVQPQNLPVTPEKTLEPTPEVPQVAQVQSQVSQGDRTESKDAVVLNVSPVVENKTNINNPAKDELSSSASFDSRSGRQIFSMPLDSSQPKLEERMPKAADTNEVKTKDNSSLVESQPHRPHRQIFSVPLNPTPIELDAKMPEVITPNKATERGSVEQALASANARIDSLQAQLKETQKSLEDLSKFVRNDNLKSWAEHKVTEVAKTSQSIAEQAKSRVMQWVQTKTVQVKLAIHDKVNEVKTAAQDKVNEVKSVAQNKVNEVKTTAQNKVDEVKSVAQNKVSEVKTATQIKGIEFKESVKEQANKFLAPVNSAQVERAAKHIVREFGDGKSYNKAATHSFQLNDKNELSVARQSDGAVIYQKGELTKAATSNDILKLNALPNVVNQIKDKQMQSTSKKQMEVGG